MSGSKPSIPLNTLEKALGLAQIWAPAIAQKGSKEYRRYRLFSALTGDEFEALAAYFIWRARGEALKEFG